MSIIGVPRCPHCKKGMNVFRIWKIKKQGEYLCPSCKNISNIYLSPLIYILAFMAIAISFAIYYFSKILFKELGIITVIYVIVPFIIFYILSLFMVYLKKPVVRKITKKKDGKYYDQNGKEMKFSMGRFVYINPADNKKIETVKIDPQADLVDIYSLNKDENSAINQNVTEQNVRQKVNREQLIKQQARIEQLINQQNNDKSSEIKKSNELIFEQKTQKNDNTSDKKYFDLFDDN